jgi:hypothetical protein
MREEPSARSLLIRPGTVAVLALTLAGCDKCGNFLGASQPDACRGELPRQR